MAPLQHPFPASDLPLQIQVTADGKMRKTQLNLEECELKQLTQYNCEVEYQGPGDKRGEIVCRPFVRLFRRCADGTNVETTVWEGFKGDGKGGNDRKMGIAGGKAMKNEDTVTR